MELGEEYEVASGARLVTRSAEAARIELRHREDGARSVILREGAADLHP